MIRHVLHGLFNTLILLVLLLIGAVALMQTGPGKRFLADQLSSLLSTPDAGIAIAGLQGWIPIDMRIQRLRLSDKAGIWLEADDIALDWSPRALFSGRIQIDTVRAARLHVARSPEGSGDIEPPSDEPFRLPELPTTLPPITVAKLEVPTIELGAPVLGEAASFELDGSLTTSDDGGQAELALDLQRKDQATAFATLSSTIGLDPLTLMIDLDAGETGNLLEMLTGRADAGDLDITLTGEGPLTDWTGRLSAATGGLGTANADLALALVEQPRIGIEASIQPAPKLLPAEINELIGERLDMTLAITQTHAQAITVERLDVGAGRLGLTAEGAADFEQGDLLLKAALDAPDLGALSSIAGMELAGKAGLTLDMGGTLQEPRGHIELRANGLGVDGIEAGDLEALVDLEATAPLDSDDAGLRISATGSAKGLVVPGTPLPDREVTFQTALQVPLSGAVTIEQAAIRSAGATLDAKGTFDPATLISDLDIELDAPALGRLARPYGQDIEGRALIRTAITTTAEAKALTIKLSAALSELAKLPPGAKELLGDKVELQASIDLDDQRYLEIGDLKLSAAETSLKGRAKLDLESRELAADIEAALPRLASLASLIGQPIKGALDLKATASGTLDAPTADLTLTSDRIDVAGEQIKKLVLAVTGRELAASPEGKVSLDLAARTLPLSLALDYRLKGDQLALPKVSLRGPQTALSGALNIDLANSLVDGALKGGVKDLAALRPLLQQSVKGSVNLDAKLAKTQARQDVNVWLKGQNIDGDFGQISQVDLSAAVEDLLGKARISTKTSVQDFKQNEMSLATLTLQTEGDLERLTIDLDLEGNAIQPLSLETDATLSLAGPITVDIDRLDGRFAGEQLRLSEPLHLEQGDENLSLSKLDLRLGQASLTGNLAMGRRDLQGRISLKSLPLAWLERFDGPELDGTASADIDLGGTVRQPKIEAAFNLAKIKADKVTATDLPPIDVTVQASLEDGRLTSSLLADGLTEEPIRVSVAHPLTLTLRPFALDVAGDGELEGDIKLAVELERIADILALDEQILKGALSADLTLGGTIKAPNLDGPISLKDGVYENGLSGTALRNLTMQANASSERLTVERLSGTVGADGTVKAEGWVGLDPEADFPLTVSVRLDDAQLVSRDDAEATIAGDISVEGDLSDALIKGDLQVMRAEISIPEGGGPNLPDIDIEEIGGNIVNKVKVKKVKEQPFDPKLDISIDLPNQVYVRGRGLDSEWQGKLDIVGTASEPLITGSLEVKTGYFDFIDKRFVIERGDIDFNGSSPPNPILALEAAATDDDFKAIIRLDGPANDPKLTLESEPVLPEDEILARLLFNRELSEIGAVEAAKLALAVNRLRGGGGFDAFAEIRNVLQIDTLDVVGGEEASDSKVKAGKYLSDDVYLEVEQGAAGDSGRARVEVEILPNISLEADTGEDSNGGVGLKWHFDY